MKKYVLFVVIMAAGVLSCQKESKNPAFAKLKVTVSHTIYGQPFSESDFNQMKYVSCSNDTFSISRIDFILSKFTFYKKGKPVYVDKHSYFCSKSSTSFVIDSIPPDTYDAVSFSFGDNKPADSTNTDIKSMYWPAGMGGGYHFMKYEGYFLDSSLQYGYALHAGGNSQTPPVLSFTVSLPLKFYTHELTITQSLNTWFDGPPYCFNLSQANYTMGSDSLMSVLLNNGKNAFSVKFIK